MPDKDNYGRLRWRVAVKGSDSRGRVYKRFPAAELRAANAYARRAEDERAALGDVGFLAQEERELIAAWRKEAAAMLRAGVRPPAAAELIRDGVRRLMEAARSATFDAAAADYVRLHANAWKPARRSLVESCFRRFRDALGCGAWPLSRFSADDVVRGVAIFTGAEASQQTRAYYLRTLAAMWTRAQEQGYAPSNPAKEAGRLTAAAKQAKPVEFYSVEEVKQLLAAAFAHADRAEATAFVVRLLTGTRPAEVARLQWGDLRLEDPTPYIFLPTGKAKTLKQRCVYLQGTHAAILRAIMPKYVQADAPLLKGYASDKQVRERLFKVATDIAAAAGLSQARKKGVARERKPEERNILRHTAATYLVAYMGEVGKAALILGHTEAVCREHYLGVATKQAAQRFFNLAVPGAAAAPPREYAAGA